jgi:hypothetical protein
MDLVCWLGLLHSISTFFSVLVSDLYMHYKKFYYTFSCYLLLTNSNYRSMYSCSYTDIGCVPFSRGRGGPISKHINGFENNKNWSCVPTEPETKNDCADEDRKKFTAMLCYIGCPATEGGSF